MFSGSLPLPPRLPLHLSAKVFLITNLKFRMDRGWEWRSLSLSWILPPHQHILHLHPSIISTPTPTLRP